MPLDHSRSRFARAADARRAAVGILEEPASMTLSQIRARYPIAARILRRLLREHALPESVVETLSTSALASIEDGDHPARDALLLMLPPPEQRAC